MGKMYLGPYCTGTKLPGPFPFLLGRKRWRSAGSAVALQLPAAIAALARVPE